MTIEKEIDRYRDQYLAALTPAARRKMETVIHTLGKLVPEYKNYLVQLKTGQVIYQVSFNQLINYVKEYLAANFSYEANQQYRYLLSREKAVAGNAKTNGSKRAWAKALARKHEAQCEYLEELYDCISNYGLHPAIENRDPAKHARYNLVVEYRAPKGRMPVEYVQLLSLQQLTAGFINCYHAGTPLALNGVRIAIAQIKKVAITATLLTDEEVVRFKQKHNLATDIDFIRQCKDETNNLLLAQPAPVIYRDDIMPHQLAQQQVLNGFIGPGHQAIPEDIATLNQALIKCIYELQKQGHRLIQRSAGKRAALQENYVRNLFKLGLADRYPAINAESEQRRGRVDLKIQLPGSNKQWILEFKCWSNQDKKQVALQALQYLTDFEDTAFIIMISHLQSKDITTHYQRLIEQQSNGCIPDSWSIITYPGTPFQYYRSEHRIDNKVKVLYHFICRL